MIRKQSLNFSLSEKKPKKLYENALTTISEFIDKIESRYPKKYLLIKGLKHVNEYENLRKKVINWCLEHNDNNDKIDFLWKITCKLLNIKSGTIPNTIKKYINQATFIEEATEHNI